MSVVEGPRAVGERSTTSSAVEHYCIASFIGSEGSDGTWNEAPGPVDVAASSSLGYCALAGDGPAASSAAECADQSWCSGGVGVGSASSADLQQESRQASFAPPAVAARISGRSRKFYAIEVSGSADALPAWKLHRRYSEFVTLDQQVRHKFAGLPQLPRKSVFTKRLDPGFLRRRERGLEAYLMALVSADPVLEEPAVRTFLDPQVQTFRNNQAEITGTLGSRTSSRRSSCCSRDSCA
uniref:PX domain-containing protein n=1 Tax=Alexandrium andersonii TaxID=327968 RepID=A0A7S2D390_9DINO